MTFRLRTEGRTSQVQSCLRPLTRCRFEAERHLTNDVRRVERVRFAVKRAKAYPHHIVNLALPVAEILRIARSHGAVSVRVFGSRARGDAQADSDLDLLIGLEPDRSLLDIVAIEQDLEDLLGYPVDVVTERGLSPYLRDRVLAEALPLSA
jgi:uncharacterized protein